MRRFVILGTQRAGTVLLQDLLSSHPDAHCWGEILLGMDGPTQSGYPRALHTHRTLRHAWQYLFSGSAIAPRRVIERAYADRPESAVGFRIMYNQLRRRETHAIKDLSLDVIHVVRANSLRQYVSLQQMRNRQASMGAQSAHSTAAVTFSPVTINPARALAFVEQRERDRRRVERLFAAQIASTICYERDIEGRRGYPDGFMPGEPRSIAEVGADLVGALGLGRAELRSDFKKTGTRDLSEAVANYDAVEAAFRDSSSAWMLAF